MYTENMKYMRLMGKLGTAQKTGSIAKDDGYEAYGEIWETQHEKSHRLSR